MTIAQWKTPEVLLPIKFIGIDEPVPMFYQVTLYKLNGKWNDFVLGSVVTHLPLQDWCAMKGYKLVEVYKGTRPAEKGEKTDLL